MTNMDRKQKTALITGASGGLGVEFSRIFAREGYDLVLTGRKQDKLENIKSELEAAYSVRVWIYAKDLIEKDAGKEIFEFTQQKGIEVDVLINNAGFGDFGEYAQSDWNKQYDMIQLNITALCQLTRCFLPSMIQRGKGRIVNLASVAAFLPGPLMSVYYSTKAFVLSFTQALSVELQGTGVFVMTLCPGPTKTGFEELADLKTSGLFKNLSVASPKDVAEYGYRQMMNNKLIAVPGFMNKMMTFAPRFFPRKLVSKCVYLVQK